MLLVGQTNEQAAKVAIGSSDLIQTALQQITGAPAAGLGNLQGNANPFLRQLNVAVSPWLETAAIPGNSTTAFYLFGDPRAIVPIYVTFLDGDAAPDDPDSGSGLQHPWAADACLLRLRSGDWRLPLGVKCSRGLIESFLPLASTGRPRHRGRGIFTQGAVVMKQFSDGAGRPWQVGVTLASIMATSEKTEKLM